MTVSGFPYWGELFSISTAVVWALGVIFFKKSGETMHPVALNLFKNILGFILIFFTMRILGEPMVVKAPPDIYWLLLASGVLGIGVSDTLFFKSLNLVGAGLSAIIDCLYSPFIIGLSILFIGEHLTFQQGLGAAVIVAGVLTATNKKVRAGVSPKEMILGYTYGILAVFTLAVGIVMVKPILGDYSILWVTQVRLLGGSIPLVLYTIFHSDRSRIILSMTFGKGWFHALSGSFLGSYVALILWMLGMKLTQASVSAALNQTSTIFIFIFSAWLLKEPLNRQRITAVLMGVAGSVLVVFA